MENKKKAQQLVILEEQLNQLRSWTDSVHNLIADRFNIEWSKHTTSYDNLTQRLVHLQTRIDRTEGAITKHSSESTALHDQATKSNDRHFEKLRDLMADTLGKTISLEKATIAMAELVKANCDHLADLTHHIDSHCFSIRILCILNVIGLGFLAMIFYRSLTWF